MKISKILMSNFNANNNNHNLKDLIKISLCALSIILALQKSSYKESRVFDIPDTARSESVCSDEHFSSGR